jgi:hypothetical protein
MKNKLKLSLVAVILSFCAFLIQNSFSNSNFVQTVEVKENYRLTYNYFASLTPGKQAYGKAQYFTSDILTAAEEFTFLAFKFDLEGDYHHSHHHGDHHHDGMPILEVSVLEDNWWSPWQPLDMDHDLIDEHGFQGFILTNGAKQFKYRFYLEGDGYSSPVIENLEWTAIHTSDPAEKWFQTASASVNDPLDIISREQWGANTDYLYATGEGTNAQIVKLEDDFYEKFKDELTISQVIDRDSSGEYYKWPMKYPEDVSKIIVHHTATSKNLDNPKQAIRDMYYYHSVSRGWGDIGYNYIIDQEGNIYEGRQGGEGVIGAHSGRGNHGSIGISLLGNFQDQPPTSAAVTSLVKMIYYKSKVHGINPSGFSNFRGEYSSNILGHRDVTNTICPGDQLYALLDAARKNASSYFTEKPKKKYDYDFQDRSELFFLEIEPLKKQFVQITVENIGKKTWKSPSVKLDSLTGSKRSLTINDASSKESVKYGESITFNLSLNSRLMSDDGVIKLAVYSEDNKMRDLIKIPYRILKPEYTYDVISNTKLPDTTEPGSKHTLNIKLKNTSSYSWFGDGENKVYIKGDHYLGSLKQKEVKPGEEGDFYIIVNLPEQAGSYRESIDIIAGSGVFPNSDALTLNTFVYDPNQSGDAKILKISPQIKSNSAGHLEIVNTSGETWRKENLKLHLTAPNGVFAENIKVNSPEIKPGETLTVDFDVKLGNDFEKQLINLLQIMLTHKDEPILDRPVNHFFSSPEDLEEVQLIDQAFVEETPTISGDSGQPYIRIKLTFDQPTAIVSADQNIKIYEEKSYLTTLDASENISVSFDNGTYILESENYRNEISSFPRFEAENGGIMQVNNLEKRPGWNLDLNDNLFRGVIEVREDEGKLIVINELPVEDYLRGLGEVSNSQEFEKMKTIMVAARTYALFYLTEDRKFPGKPYDLDDNPDVSQRYLGYNLELRADKVSEAVDETFGQVVYYDGKLIKTPYFNESDGRTKSAEEVWGWTNTPYLVSVDDSFCEANAFNGHGVGLSGCGATGMAQNGFNYQEILSHYYIDTDLVKQY